jgi:hypothetical protein
VSEPVPLLGFTVCYEQIKDGRKQQTIRVFRKNAFQIDDNLFAYWKLRTKECEKFGEAPLTQLFFLRLSEMLHCEEIAHWDGFPTTVHMWSFFKQRIDRFQKTFQRQNRFQTEEAIQKTDPILHYFATDPDPFFTVIRFAPDWIPKEQHIFPRLADQAIFLVSAGSPASSLPLVRQVTLDSWLDG